MAISSIKTNRLGTLISAVALASAMCAAPIAQAGVLNFETELDSPFLFSGDHVIMGDFWVESYGGTEEYDFVGAVVDNDSCFAIACPVNNPSRYYTGLNDGYFYFGKNDNSTFRLQSLQASFIGTGEASYPSVAGMLVLQGYDVSGSAAAPAMQLALDGPANGSFHFANYNLGNFGMTEYAFVRVLGYACDTGGNCNRNTNQANFAIDNITMVPEPGSFALLGLGLLGLAAFSRRRAA